MKKIIGFLMAVLLIFSTIFVPVGAIDFVDISTEDKALVEAVDLLTYMNIAKGKSETNFGTNEAVTREQFALFVYRLLKGGKDAPKNSVNTTMFIDLEDPTYNYAISWANSQGIIKGTSATIFNPKGNITLRDAYTMLVRALGYEKVEELSYPFGYIEIAENAKTALNKNINADYTDILTRGDMAKLIYNAFFAETGVAEIKLVEYVLSDDSRVLVEEEYYPVFCEKYFDVIEAEYEVIATPNFIWGDADETTADIGDNIIELRKVSENQKVPTQFYVNFDELNIRGNPDDYIMGHFNMYITVDSKNNLDRILYAETLLNKIVTDDAKLYSVNPETKTDYYDNNPNNDPILSGKIEIDGKIAYFFNAPYSYAEPINNTETERNAKNLKFIDLNYNFHNESYTYEVNTEKFDADKLIDKMALVHTNGIYKIEIIDVDGDKIYDYINYMPYKAYTVSTDEDYTFADTDFSDDIVYTNEATITGADFKDEDYVIGYFNQDANYIDIYKVIKPISAEVKGYSAKNGTITLTNGKTYDAYSSWKLLENFRKDFKPYEENKPSLKADNVILKNDTFYIYNGIILNTEIEETYVEYTDNLIIPMNIKTPRIEFNSKTGEDTTYIYAWIDGETKYIPVVTEDIYPAIIDKNNKVSGKYAEQLCTYTLRNGIYTITSLGYAEDEDGISEAMETDASKLNTEKKVQIIVLNNPEEEVTMTKYAGSRFTLSNLTNKVMLEDYTRIIVKIWDSEKDEYEFVEYSAEDFTASVESKIETITYIVANDTERTDRDNLVVLYMTVIDDFDLAAKIDKNGYRIVRNSKVGLDSDDEYRNIYKVLNPFTGKIETVMGLDTASKMSGIVEAIDENSFVKLVDGCIDETKDVITVSENWIVDYDNRDEVISLVEVKDWCEDCITEKAETLVMIDNNTVITIMTEEDFELTNIDTIANPAKKNLTYNSKAYNEKKDKLYTEYAPFIRAYVEYNKEDKNLEYPIAEFIVIIVEDTNKVIPACESHK